MCSSRGFIQLYVPFLTSLCLILLRQDGGEWWVLAFIILAVALRHRRVRGGPVVRQAPDGAADQPEEDVGGLRRRRCWPR